MEQVILTRSEQRAFDVLVQKSGMIVSRDEIAQAVWGERWLKKYSDWQIDRLVYLLRKKLSSDYKIKTLRNSGYILNPEEGMVPDRISAKVNGTLPTKSYLEYMNNPKNKRKVLKDLFGSLKRTVRAKKILVINSYSADNVDEIYHRYPEATAYFSNFDQRALDLHQERMEKLSAVNFHSVFDDIRDSIFKDAHFDLIINDFRLNFNLTNAQNVEAIRQMRRILRNGGKVLVSVVVDPRFESVKYGSNQENAPINKDKPWHFEAEEKLVRKCFTVPYYRQLFESNGFGIEKEFDIEGGKKWVPPFRRFVLKKR